MFENYSPAQAAALNTMALAFGQKNDPSRNPTGPYGHGPQGLFALAGQDRQVFSAMLLPTAGMLGEIPVFNGQDDAPSGEFGGVNTQFFTTLTGITAGDGDDFTKQPTTDCADGALAGLMKACTLVSTYARYRFSPNPISIFRAGQLRDIADPTYLTLMNQPGGYAAAPFQPSVPQGNVLVNEAARRFFELRAIMSRFMSRRIWIGSPANNSGERRDLTGFNLQINKGNHYDAISGGACAAMDSVVEDLNYNIVNSANSGLIVSYIDSIAYQLMWNSSQMGLDPVDWVIAMRSDLFDEVVKMWPIQYYQEALGAMGQYAQGRVTINASEAAAMRDDMRNNLFLPIRGRRWRVVLDNGITEQTVTNTARLAGGQYASSIYFIPMTVLGGVPVTYFKYFNQANAQAEAIVRQFGIVSTFTSDSGVFRWYINHKNGCVDMTVDFAPRLILRTPQVAARLDNVAYAPRTHARDAYPDSNYFANGGRTNLPQFPTFYTEWSTSTPTAL